MLYMYFHFYKMSSIANPQRQKGDQRLPKTGKSGGMSDDGNGVASGGDESVLKEW